MADQTRIRTAEETAAQRPEIPTAAEVAQISAGWREATRLRQELDAAYLENGRVRQERDEACRERASLARRLAIRHEEAKYLTRRVEGLQQDLAAARQERDEAIALIQERNQLEELRQEALDAYAEPIRAQLTTETAERVAAQRELADVRIQRDRLAADHTALTARHHAQGQELDDARQEAIRLGHELHLRDAVAPYAEAEADEKQLAGLRAQLGAALDALHAARDIVGEAELAALRTAQQPTAPDPAEQLVAAHRAGYDQAITNLRDLDRLIAWQMSDSPRGGGTLVADYLADTYETPA